MEQRWLNPKVFSPEYCVVFSDRSLSTAALRRLQEERVRCASWPNPGTFSFPQLARAITQQLWRRSHGPHEFPRLLKPYEQLTLVLKTRKDLVDPLRAWQQLESLSNLHKFPLSPELLESLIHHLESSNQREELKETTQALLSFLVLYRHQEVCPSALASEWGYVPHAVSILKSSESIPWGQFLQIDPLSTSIPKLLIPSHKELYPLEQALLEALTPHLEVEFFEQPQTKETETLVKFPYKVLTRDSVIFWAYTSEKPRPIEAHEVLAPSEIPLDIQVSPPDLRAENLRALFQWCEFHELGKPPFHALLRDQAIQDHLANWQLPLQTAPTHTLVRTYFERHWPEDLEAYAALQEHFAQPSSRMLLLLLSLGLCHKEDQEVLTPTPLPWMDPEGVPVLALEDLPFFAVRNQTLLWTDEQTLHDQLQEDSKCTLSKNLFDPPLRDALEAEGLRVPDAGREALALKSLVHHWKDHLFLLNLKTLRPSVLEDTPLNRSELKLTHVSPTGLESYHACPFRFYLERMLRLQETIPWDDPKLRATSLGTWIHKVLEEFFQKPDFKDPRPHILRLLQLHLEPSFSENHSPAFLELVQRSVSRYCDPLVEHILQFEAPLRELFRLEASHLEQKIESQWKGYQLKGTIDRVDIGKEGLLLFDYKTGRYASSAKTLIKDSKFQWFLYRRLVQDLYKKPVLAGGYINPLFPDRSRLFIFQQATTHLESLCDFLEESAFKVERISAEAEGLLESDLDQILNAVHLGLHNNEFPPRPRDESLCSPCSHKGICGRPYLLLDGDPL